MNQRLGKLPKEVFASTFLLGPLVAASMLAFAGPSGVAATQRSDMEVKGSMISNAHATGPAGFVSDLTFSLANVGRENIDLKPGNTIIKYTDANQTHIFDKTPESNFTVTGGDNYNLLERGESVKIKITGMYVGCTLSCSPLATNLGTNTTFNVEVIPPTGAILFIERTTPASFNATDSLE